MHGRNLVSTGAHAATLAALALVALLGGCRDNATTGPSHLQAKDFAAIVRSISGDQQVGAVGVALAQQLTVKVVDANGLPVVGATVRFGVLAGGGSINPPADTSGSGGLVSTTWTLGMTVGAQKMAASVANVDSVTFTATATATPAAAGGGGTPGAAAPTTVVVISGSGQVGRSATALASPLVVEVRDGLGNPLPNISVSFTQAAGNSDGFTSPSPVVSGADGRVSVTWTLGHNSTNTTVTQFVTAGLPGSPAVPGVTFSATARPDFRIVRIRTPPIMSDTTGATIGYPGDYSAGLRDTLIVQVYDPSDSTGVQGVAVTWNVVTVSGGSAVNSVVNTDNFGFAKTTWSLVGAHPSDIAHRMVASAASVGQVEFQAHVFPGNGVGVSVSSPPPPDSAGTGSTFIVTVTDVGGNPIPGALVTHTAIVGGGAVFDPGVPTGSAGTLLFGWHFGGVHGSVQSVTVMSVSTGFYGNITTAFGFVAVETP